jgi:hypothetical protein
MDCSPAAPCPSAPPSSLRDSPLTPQQHQQFARAQAEAAKLTRATGMAGFNGWSMLIVALCCVPFAYLDWTNAVVAIVLGVIGSVELWGRTRLRKLDPEAGWRLAINQLVLLAGIWAYCAWRIYAALTGPDMLAEHPELAELKIDLAGLQRTIAWAVYGAVAGGSAIYQGLCALYYFNTGRRLREYVEQTPPWIVQLQRGG